jgi:hypothetical protein
MPSEGFKALLHKESSKAFLWKLYSPKSNSAASQRREKGNVINSATVEQVNVLIKVIHLVLTGEITFRKTDYEKLKKSKRIPYLTKHFLENYKELRQMNTEEKKEILKHLNCYPELLHTLFNLTKKK